jgi:aspartyl-tRNA(Asn)/glutamyl-tRNA(Gln) amidotransferase subunit C
VGTGKSDHTTSFLRKQESKDLADDTRSIAAFVGRSAFALWRMNASCCAKIRFDSAGEDRRQNVISEEQVRHVANLARLGLTDDEIAKMGTQLDAILDSIEKIRELDLADVPPTANPLNLSNVLRPDEPRPELSQEEALAPAPERVDDLFAVPRID